MAARGKKILLLGCGIVFGLLILESTLRFAGAVYWKRRAIPVSTASDRFNILCLGESSTFGLWVPQKDSYPKQLESMLNGYYGINKIQTVVPVHIGQNSSQIANRIEDYLQNFEPKLVIAMVGVNNEWSFAENNFVRYLDEYDSESLKIRLNALFDRLRIYKVVRFSYKQIATGYARTQLILGAPEFDTYPPPTWKLDFAKRHQEAFASGWEFDLRTIIRKSRSRNARVIVMNYHLNPPFLTTKRLKTIAKEEGAVSLFNDSLWGREVTKKKLSGSYLLHDNWHPSKEGYKLIATNVFRLIRSQNLLELTPDAPAL